MAAAISPPSSSLTQTDVSRLSSINFSGRTPQIFDIAGAIGLEIGGLTATEGPIDAPGDPADGSREAAYRRIEIQSAGLARDAMRALKEMASTTVRTLAFRF
jgi:hypothetical protein